MCRSALWTVEGAEARAIFAQAPRHFKIYSAVESEAWDLGLDWLNPAYVSQAIVFCVKQDANTILPELRVYHRAQI